MTEGYIEMPELPPPLMTSEPGSFARKTIVERKPQIIARVIEDNAYAVEIIEALRAFQDEIVQDGARGAGIQPLREQAGDVEFWNRHWARYEGRTWLELPWYFAETFFYRRLLEAVRYFQPGPWLGLDPFEPQKRAQEAGAVEQLATAWARIAATPLEERFEPLLHACLWGNRADLSNLTVREEAMGDTAVDRGNILIDNTSEVREYLSTGAHDIAFISDNVGADSLFDLVIADYLLERGWADAVTFHLKSHPFFVSDAMPQDVRHMLTRLKRGPADGVVALGERLDAELAGGRLRLTTHPFWTRCLGFREMPADVIAALKEADLVILKGDVNYRRLLDDRHWPSTTPMEPITRYFPRPFLVLRTLKGEIIVGLTPDQVEELEAQDPTWLINGKRGLVQLITDP
ncbi:MAG: damage-control phosphatase ARMT1 family protein [Anaerolineae bacterium]